MRDIPGLVTDSSRPGARRLLITCAGLAIASIAVAAAVRAQQPATEPVATPAPSAESAPPTNDAKAPTPAQDAATEAPKPPADAKGSPQRFEPTEKVRPDFDVAFPVDI